MWKRIKSWFMADRPTIDEEIQELIKVHDPKIEAEYHRLRYENRARIKDELIATGKHGPKTGTVLSGKLLDEMARA